MKTKALFLIGWLTLSVLSAQVQFPNSISKTEKVYGLSKFWQEINYNFVYLNDIDREQWEQDYKRLIGEVQETKNDYEYYRLLEKFCATLNDGHTNIFYPKAIDEKIYTSYFGDYRFYVQLIEGKAIITTINESKKEEIPIGTEIIKVNGMDTFSYAEKNVKPYISSSTDYVLEGMMIWNLLRAPEGTSFDLKLRKPNGIVTDLRVTHTESKDEKMFPEENYGLFEFKWVDHDIAYLALNSFMDGKLNELFIEKLPEIRKAKKLIIDLRKNGGGRNNIAMDILQYLTYDNELQHAAYRSRLHIPYYKSSGKYLEAKDTLVTNAEVKEWRVKSFLSYQDNYWYKFPYETTKVDLEIGERIVVPTAILVGHGTASTSEDFLIAAENQEHMIRIGEESNGSTGQPMHFDLPGGGSARLCTKKDTYPDGRLFVGVGIQPNIRVEPTLEDFMNKNDPVLSTAIKYLNGIVESNK